MKNKVLVTGGAGFMGSYFIKYLISKHPYIEIINLDTLTYAGNLNNLSSVVSNDRYKFVEGNITDIDLLEKLREESITE